MQCAAALSSLCYNYCILEQNGPPWECAFLCVLRASQTHQIQLRVTETVETLQTPTTNGQIHSDKHHENHKHKKHQRNQKKNKETQKTKKPKKNKTIKETTKKQKKPKKNNKLNKNKENKKPRKPKKKPKQQNSRTPAKFMAHAENSGKLFLFGFLVLLQFPWSRCWFPSHCFLRAGKSARGLPFVPIKRTHNCMFPCCWLLYYVLQCRQYHSICINP